MQYLITLPVESFLDLLCRLIQLTHYRTVLLVQTLIIHHNLQQKKHLNTLNPFSTSQHSTSTRNILQNSHFQIPKPYSTTTRINPHINATYKQPVTITSHISSNVSTIPTYITVPPSTLPQFTHSQPTYINSSTSISEPIKPSDDLNHNYTPEEYLQQFEACVTFSLDL